MYVHASSVQGLLDQHTYYTRYSARVSLSSASWYFIANPFGLFCGPVRDFPIWACLTLIW
jgi:hypothetical protein